MAANKSLQFHSIYALWRIQQTIQNKCFIHSGDISILTSARPESAAVRHCLPAWIAWRGSRSPHPMKHAWKELSFHRRSACGRQILNLIKAITFSVWLIDLLVLICLKYIPSPSHQSVNPLCCLLGFHVLVTSEVYQEGCTFLTVYTDGDFCSPTERPDIPLKLHYPDTELTRLILVIPSARLGSDKYQFCESLVWLGQDSNSCPSTQETCDLSNSDSTSIKQLSSSPPTVQIVLLTFTCLRKQIDWFVVVLRHDGNNGHIHGEKCLSCILSFFA